MSTKVSMIKSIVVAVALAAGASSVAQAADNGARASNFAKEDRYLQDESTAMPHESAPVDRSAAPADPIPRASAYGGERARFDAMDRTLQSESTGMPAVSPPVDRSAVNADPAPRGSAEEQFLQQNSTK